MSFSFYQQIPGGFVFGSSPGAVTNQARDVPAHNSEQVEPDVEMMPPQETLSEQNSTIVSDFDFYMDPLPREMTASPENGVDFQPGAGSATADEVDGQAATQLPVTPGKHNGMHIELDVDKALPVSPQGASEQSTVESSSDIEFENVAVIPHDHRASASHPFMLNEQNRTETPFITPRSSPPASDKQDSMALQYADFEMDKQPMSMTTAGLRNGRRSQSCAGSTMCNTLPHDDPTHLSLDHLGRTRTPFESNGEMTLDAGPVGGQNIIDPLLYLALRSGIGPALIHSLSQNDQGHIPMTQTFTNSTRPVPQTTASKDGKLRAELTVVHDTQPSEAKRNIQTRVYKSQDSGLRRKLSSLYDESEIGNERKRVAVAGPSRAKFYEAIEREKLARERLLADSIERKKRDAEIAQACEEVKRLQEEYAEWKIEMEKKYGSIETIFVKTAENEGLRKANEAMSAAGQRAEEEIAEFRRETADLIQKARIADMSLQFRLELAIVGAGGCYKFIAEGILRSSEFFARAGTIGIRQQDLPNARAVTPKSASSSPAWAHPQTQQPSPSMLSQPPSTISISTQQTGSETKYQHVKRSQQVDDLRAEGATVGVVPLQNTLASQESGSTRSMEPDSGLSFNLNDLQTLETTKRFLTEVLRQIGEIQSTSGPAGRMQATEMNETAFVLAAISRESGKRKAKESPKTWNTFKIAVHACACLASLAFILQNLGINTGTVEKVMHYLGI